MSRSHAAIAHLDAGPDPWILRFCELVRGDVLDLACGAGRHTRYFLGQGRRVVALDRDTGALADISGDGNLEIMTADLETAPPPGADHPWPLGARRFDAVIVTNYLWRPLLPHIVGAVAEGGVLLYRTFAQGNEAYGRPRNPDYLLRPGELLDAVSGRLQVIAYEHGTIETPGSPPGRAVIQQICARHSEVPANLIAS